MKMATRCTLNGAPTSKSPSKPTRPRPHPLAQLAQRKWPRSVAGGCRPFSSARLVRQSEADGHGGFYFQRRAVQQVGAVFPLPDRVNGRRREQGMAADQLKIGYVAFLVDDRLQFDCALDTLCLGVLWD